MARGRGEGARRSAVGGRGNKPIDLVPKAEIVGLSMSRFLRVFLTATPYAFRLEARMRGLKIKLVRRMGDHYRRAIDLVSSGTRRWPSKPGFGAVLRGVNTLEWVPSRLLGKLEIVHIRPKPPPQTGAYRNNDDAFGA